jgi:hypothetical protein
LRHPDRTEVRQVAFFQGEAPHRPATFTAKMKRKIDSAVGRWVYSGRLATAEPVFANITTTRRLNRFTLRGKRKVNTQWLLYCLVHNLGKSTAMRRDALNHPCNSRIDGRRVMKAAARKISLRLTGRTL